MACLRRANRWDRGAGRFIAPQRRGHHRPFVCLLSCVLLGLPFGAGRAAAPVAADLSLGTKAPEKSDLLLKPGGEVTADVLAHYSAALQFESSGKLRQALEHYLAVFKADPTNAGLAAHTAGIAMQFQGREAALKVLEEAVRASPRSPAPLLNLARFCSTYPPEDLLEKEDRALQAVTTALAQFPGHAEVYEAAVLFHLTANQREKAVHVMELAAKQPSRDPQFWLALGRTTGRVWPLGQAEFQTEYRERVEPFFENALKHVTKADVEEVTLEVAQQCLLTNDLNRARQLCEKLVATHNNLEARKLLYRLYEAAEEKEKALATLEAIVKQTPTDAEQQRLLAAEYEKRKQPQKAIPPLEAAIQNGGGEIGDYVKLGWQFYQTQRFEDMVRLGQRSVRLFPTHPFVHYQLAIAYRAREEWASSVKHFAEAEQHASANQAELLDHLFYFQYGITLEKMERFEDASRMLEKSITLTPREETKTAANTLNFLGYMWLEQGSHLDKAGEFITKANELLPNQPAYIDSLGWFHYKKANYPAALKELQRAEALLQPVAPEDAEILEHIGLTYQALGDKPKALDYLERADALKTPDSRIRKRIEEGLKKMKGSDKPAVDTEKK